MIYEKMYIKYIYICVYLFGEEMLYLHKVSPASSVFLSFSRELNRESYNEHTKPNSIIPTARCP